MKLRMLATCGALAALLLTQSAWAGLREGNNAFRNGDYETAFKEWELLADQGEAEALNNLALLYSSGRGVEKDEHKALGLLLLAAEQSLSEAQYNLGILYGRIEGFERNQVKAVRWLLRAAEQGHTKAQLELTRRYEQGVGVERDYVQALRWAILASDTASGRTQDRAIRARDNLMAKLTPSQIAKSRQLVADARN